MIIIGIKIERGKTGRGKCVVDTDDPGEVAVAIAQIEAIKVKLVQSYEDLTT